MIQLDQLMDLDLLDTMLEQGFVRKQDHPSLPLEIYNYTEAATFDRVWNEVTLQCRGLIVDEGLQVIARPFSKFFNWGEESGTFALETYRNASVTVTDKLDGSLGILYPEGEGWAVATRGSFASPQALHATGRLQEYLALGWTPPEGYTLLFEIIYPENRIVCNYYGLDDLVLLGTRSIAYGYTTGPQTVEDWPGPRAEVFKYRTFQQALDAQHRKGAEGLVVHFHDNDKRIKLKQPDYVLLHRIVTGLNERAVWEAMKNGTSLEEIQRPLPEEFHPWVKTTYEWIQANWYDIYWLAQNTFKSLSPLPGVEQTRKDFALKAVKHAFPGLLFKLYDCKDIGDDIWKLVKPEYSKGPWSKGEDVA